MSISISCTFEVELKIFRFRRHVQGDRVHFCHNRGLGFIFYTIEIVGVVVGAGRGQFWTGNRPFLRPEGESGAVPEPPGDPGERPDAPTSKISDTC